MADELSSALLKNDDLRVIVVTATDTARSARDRHKARGAAAGVLAQGLSTGLLMGALAKENSRVNLQVECDGPLRGMFVDADNQGSVRGYVKNPLADVEVASSEYRYRPVLGNKGFISVLRDLGGGEYYRSSVELEAMELSKDVERYFRSSEQIETVIRLAVLPKEGEPLGQVGGLLLQPLPSGNREELKKLVEALDRGHAFDKALAEHGDAGAHAVLKALFPREDLEVMARYPARFQCRCSKERVINALSAMRKEELEDLLAKEGKAEATCDFCATTYVVSADELRALIKQLENLA